jgi:5-formyltetrahydrofolate cyclo-ligase
VYDAAHHPLPREEHDILVHAVATTTDWRWLG